MRAYARIIAMVMMVVSSSLVSTACSYNPIKSIETLKPKISMGIGEDKDQNSQDELASESEFSKFKGSLNYTVVDTNGTIYVGDRTWVELSEKDIVPEGDALKKNRHTKITRADATYLFTHAETYEYNSSNRTSGRRRTFSLDDFSPSTEFRLVAVYMAHDTYDGVRMWD